MQRQTSISFSGIDSVTPINEPLCGKYLKTFAYYTVKDRLPVILTKVVDHLSRDKEDIIRQYGQETEEDIKSIIGQISKLKNEVQTNKSLVPLTSGADAEVWNKYISSEEEPCWFQSTWLLVENYMYRRLHEMFDNSVQLKSYDYFQVSKESAFKTVVSSLKHLGNKVLSIVEDPSTDMLETDCVELLKLSLWANRCDLSLSCGEQTSDEDNTLSNVKVLDQFILSDDSRLAAHILINSSNSVIEIVQDNAGYELFADLCLADFLVSKLNVSHVKFQIKRIPWYVSDVTERDFHWVIEETGVVGMNKLADRWKQHLKQGRWSIEANEYWTLPFDYNEMNTRAPTLYQSLSKSKLVIFKGDLNYRKLMGDLNWPMTESFDVCLRSFRPTNVLSLRTVKADVVCGLKPGVAEELTKKDPEWMTTGEYGVIQCLKVD